MKRKQKPVDQEGMVSMKETGFAFYDRAERPPFPLSKKLERAAAFADFTKARTPYGDRIAACLPPERTAGKTLLDLYKEKRPAQGHRGRGGSSATALDGYQEFFAPYSDAMIQAISRTNTAPSRDKVLHLCVVLGIRSEQTERLLRDMGYRGLSFANPLELCIQYVLETACLRGEDADNMAALRDIYQKVCQVLDEHRDDVIPPPEGLQAEDPSRYAQSRYVSKQLADYQAKMFRASLSEDIFLDNVRALAPYLRYHSKGIEQAYLDIKQEIEDTLRWGTRSLEASAASSTILAFFSKYTGWSKESFLEITRHFAAGFHFRRPTREFLLLAYLYRETFVHERYPLEQSVNDFLEALSFPQLNQNRSFDRLIQEILRYKVTRDPQGTLTQLLDAYQAACGGETILSCQISEQVGFSLLRVAVRSAGVPLPNVRVILTAPDLSGEISRTTNEEGITTFQNIPFSSYRLTVCPPGSAHPLHTSSVTLSRTKPSYTQQVDLPAT